MFTTNINTIVAKKTKALAVFASTKQSLIQVIDSLTAEVEKSNSKIMELKQKETAERELIAQAEKEIRSSLGTIEQINTFMGQKNETN